MIAQVRDTGGFSEGSENASGGKCSDSGYILKVKVRMKVGHKRKKEKKGQESLHEFWTRTLSVLLHSYKINYGRAVFG